MGRAVHARRTHPRVCTHSLSLTLTHKHARSHTDLHIRDTKCMLNFKELHSKIAEKQHRNGLSSLSSNRLCLGHTETHTHTHTTEGVNIQIQDWVN